MTSKSFLFAAVVLAACRNERARDPEAATAEHFTQIRSDSTKLLKFLQQMPKGGDLHNHLAGAINAEVMIKWAAEERLCVMTATMALSAGPCARSEGMMSAAKLAVDSSLRAQAIDAWTMRNWRPGAESGHDHFFATFDKFLPALRTRFGDMLAEVTARAASEGVSYLELMVTPDEGNIISLGFANGWHGSVTQERAKLEKAGLVDSVKVLLAAIDSAEARREAMHGCKTANPLQGCQVTVRYLYQVLRGLPEQVVFAQILTGFELARLDPRVVGFNLVMPEDDSIPMRDFDLHMAMIDSLHAVFPEVAITLHAGELTPALVPTGSLGSHITKSIVRGHARRIGHGIALAHEEQPDSLLALMAREQTLVEIALTSNRFILGVQGTDHPLARYRAAGIPVALVTDDQGVGRTDMTHEYFAAVTDQSLDYRALKEMARNSIKYSFLDASTKAKLQAALEEAFEKFEREGWK